MTPPRTSKHSIVRGSSAASVWLAASLLVTGCGRTEAQPQLPQDDTSEERPRLPESPPADGLAGGAPAPAEAASATNREDVTNAFQRAWAEVLPTLMGWERDNAEYIDGLMARQPERFAVVEIACHQAAAARRRFGPSYTLQGDIQALDREGDCWEVSFSGGQKAEVVGYLDPLELRLLHLWRVPEG